MAKIKRPYVSTKKGQERIIVAVPKAVATVAKAVFRR